MRVHRTIALILGIASIACSVAIWVALGLRHVSGAGSWTMSVGTGTSLWAAAALLAALAARIGSRKWLLAVLFPVFNVAVFAMLVKLSGGASR